MNKETRPKTKKRLSKDRQNRREARIMALFSSGLTVGLLILGVAWARYRISTTGYAHIPLGFLAFWLICLGFSVWCVYDWLRY